MATTTMGARHLAAPTHNLRPRLMGVAVRSAMITLMAAAMLPAQAEQAQAQAAAAASAPALGEIVVQAKRDDAASTRDGTTTVIKAEQLEQNNAIDMAKIARYSPLISVPAAASGGANVWDSAGNTGINIRGVEGNRVSLEVDGISLPDAAPRPESTSMNSFGIGRDYFDPEMFHYVSIGSGASPAGGGTPGLGGAVSFVTKSPEMYLDGTRKLYADYKFGYASEQASRMHAVTAATALGDNLQALIVAVHRDGAEIKTEGDAVPNPDDWSSDAVLAKLNWKLARDQELRFTVDHYKAEHDRVYNNKVGALYPAGATQNSNTERTRYSVEHRYTPADNLLFDKLETKLYKQTASVEDDTNANYVTGGQPYIRNITTGYFNDSKGIAFDAVKQLNPSTVLGYGVLYEELESRRPWLEDRTVVRTGAHQITMKNRMADMDTDKLAAYVRGEFGFNLAGHQATLTPGLRAERRKLTPQNLQNYVIAVPSAAKEIREDKDTFLTPSLNFSVELTPQLSTYAQYTRGTRLPSAAERTGSYDSFSYTGAGNGYAVLGNPDLKKETSNAFEVGLKGAPTPGVEVSFSLFHTSYDNFIEYAAQPADPVNYPTITQGLFRPENVGKARIRGGEVSSRFALGQWWQPMQGYSLALAGGISRGTAENKDSGKKAELASVQPYKANATFAYDDPAKRGGGAFIVSTVRGKRATADVFTSATTGMFAVPGYTVMDLTAYWHINKHATVSGGMYNLADRKYWDYASSRSLVAGTTAATLADIERQARPGRNFAVNLKVIY
ncbi:TonB-dependent receptor [Oxalobacteraceae bacterium OTU3CAMAD1]|nr:TonB-dependent receptor [Oxalobacteraceae bacterium OTU3CAMAD1]